MSFDTMATVSASTKRATVTGGNRSAPVAHLAGLSITPLDPVDMQTRATLGVKTPNRLLQTAVDGQPDIKRGDVLVVGSEEFRIREVHDWSTFLHLYVEDLQS